MNKIVVAILAIVIVVILTVGLFIYNDFTKPDNYLIDGKYYQFKLQTPKDWIARRNTFYSNENIEEIIKICQSNKSDIAPTYKLGMFRFDSQNYPAEFGDFGYLPDGLPSGIVLEFAVNCVPEKIKNKIATKDSNLQVAGEKAFEKILNLKYFGETKQIYFLHNDLQYEINHYIYISPEDKNKEDQLKQRYDIIIKKIIASISFVN
jgi:hypothetical protein